MTKYNLNKDLAAIEAFQGILDSVVGMSECAFKAVIAATIDIYCMGHKLDRFELISGVVEAMKRNPL